MVTHAITIEGLGKRYRLGEDVNLARVIGASMNWLCRRKSNGAHDDRMIWALRDVSFNVPAGEAVAILGRNGAGKSTLLKILSRITPPTTGRATLRGRVGSLLEVGTGFHPELTGRENIFLNGAILGMSSQEIARRFDEIVAFSGIERFIDTPVKRYSSGMYVRLAFGVAAHLEPEILIVDEVLAVGDSGFQRKCLQKLDQVTTGEGRTVLFVSHNLQAVRAFCKRAILLESGCQVIDGPVEEVIARYLHSFESETELQNANLADRLNRHSGEARFRAFNAVSYGSAPRWTVVSGCDAEFQFSYEIFSPVRGLTFYLALLAAENGEQVTSVKVSLSSDELPIGRVSTARLRLPRLAIRPGQYALYALLGDPAGDNFYDVIDKNVDLPYLTVVSNESEIFLRRGYFSMECELINETNDLGSKLIV